MKAMSIKLSCRYFILGIFSLVLLLTKGYAADNNPEMNKQLNAVDKQITAVQKTLSKDKVHQDQLENDLQKIEIVIGQVGQNIHTLNQQIKLETIKLSVLNQQQLLYQQQLADQQQALANQIRAIYFVGQQNYFKLLLNQQNPSDLARNMMYFNYLNKNRLAMIADLNNILQQLRANQLQIAKQAQELKILRDQQNKQKQQSILGKQTRIQILAQLNKQINFNQQQLDQLNTNKKNLQQLIGQLQIASTQNQLKAMPISFAQLKGSLPWPTLGPITMHYNMPIDNSDLLSNGIMIKAPEGQNVYSIYPGRVMFAGWMKGFGLLMIIDHGDGYMSLYGSNESLFKKVGDDVDAGDLIAQVGETGGYSSSGLYFEIRYNGQPLNPEQWCKGR